VPAVATQQLAQISDLDLGPANSAMVKATAMYDADSKNAYLRRASGTVLAAYAKRLHRADGSSFVLAAWGDFTKDLVCSIARWKMIGDRGYNPENATDKAIFTRYLETRTILDEIVDLQNKTPRIDPDAIGSIDVDEEGPLGCSEGGTLDQADHYARLPTDLAPFDVRNNLLGNPQL
jgi:hypothetical protein